MLEDYSTAPIEKKFQRIKGITRGESVVYYKGYPFDFARICMFGEYSREFCKFRDSLWDMMLKKEIALVCKYTDGLRPEVEYIAQGRREDWA